ncbi:MAG: DnaB-like helicase C-terminal domain-containing protein [Planctomycetaceae bacterium]
MTNRSSSRPPLTSARYIGGRQAFGQWRDDVWHGTGPVLYRHTPSHPEIGPGLVTLIGGAPGGGKTAFVTQIAIDALRFSPDLRLLIANCEMSEEAILNRQLARLSGVNAELIRHRRLRPSHLDRIDTGLATLETVIDRIGFLQRPFSLSNVALTADDMGAQVVILDYLQRFTLDDEDSEPRERIGRMMDSLRRLASRGLAVIVVSALGRTRDRAGRSSYSGDGLSLASFRETSELEYGADDAFILAPIEEGDPNRVRLQHLKSRHGEQVTQDLHFNRGVQSFQPLDGNRPVAAADWSQGARRDGFDEDLRRAWDDIPSAAPDGDGTEEPGAGPSEETRP